LLGRVECNIRPSKQLSGIHAPFQLSQPERNGHLRQRASIVLECGVGNRLAQPLDGADRARQRGLGEDEHELLAADARGKVDRPQVGADEPPDLQQHGVPGGMPVGVVHPLEMVDIHHRDAQGLGGV